MIIKDMKENFTIFIVDDDDDDRNFIHGAFLKHNFTFDYRCFFDGASLMDYFNQDFIPLFPALVLLDLNMPRKDGYETLKEIKDDSRLQHIPVIILSSSTNEEDEKKCYNLGCYKFFSKPLSLINYELVAKQIIDVIRQ
jgi:CheY-like chemotaxis protein